MPKARKKVATEPPAPPIFTVREQRVMLDADLARIYGVPTFRFNEAVKRNRDRFPEDFAFQLTAKEVANLISQIAISSAEHTALQEDTDLKPQFATSSVERSSAQDHTVNSSQIAMSSNWSQFAASAAEHGGRRKLPWAFTEHGALMAANLLRSERAVQMSVYVVRAFVRMREQLVANAAILKRLAEIDRTLLQHDSALRSIWQRLQPLLLPPAAPPKRRIGFEVTGNSQRKVQAGKK